MLLEVAALTEGDAAHLAQVRALASVHQLVTLKLVALHERFATRLAHKRLGSIRVNSHVLFQVGRCLNAPLQTVHSNGRATKWAFALCFASAA